MNITTCATCALGQGGFGQRLTTALAGAGLAATIATTDCLSGCTRASTLSLRAPGKTAYLFGDLTEADLPDLLVLFTLYAAAPDGNLADARPLGQLRQKAIARIPG